MTQDTKIEAAEWGKAEYASRIQDIADAKAGMITLDDAKALAEQRRKKAGLSMSQAAALVSDHVRAIRWASVQS